MPQCLIVYFSQGGTTAQVAERIASGLRNAAYGVDLVNIRDGRPPAVRGYDLLGIGLPVYYYRPPFNVADYLNGLPHLNGLPAFVFLLHGTYRWDTGTVVRKVLTRKGARDVGCFYSYGPDIWSGYLKEGYLFSPGHPTGEELARAEAFGRDVAVRAGTDEYVCPDEDRAAPMLYRLQRFATNRWLARNVYSRLFRVDRERCTGCGICMELCPTGNIGKADGGRPVWGRDCLLCLTCEMKCPEECVVSPASWPIFSPIMRYNARLAAGDPGIDHVRLDKKQWPRLARGEVDYREITADI